MAQITLSTRISQETWAKLKSYCDLTGASQASVVNESLNAFIDKMLAKKGKGAKSQKKEGVA